MAIAPAPFSSFGWNMQVSVPDQLSFAFTSKAAVAIKAVTCISWPQACMTGFSFPSGSLKRTLLAYGSPVFSRIGRASNSARSIKVRPEPLSKFPITPWPPILSVTSNPRLLRCLLAISEVRLSCVPSSG